MNSSSVVRAFLLSPLASTMFLVVWGTLSIGERHNNGGQTVGVLIALYGLFCYVAAFLLGIPLFFAYRRFHITSPVSYGVGGAGIGIVFCLILLFTGYGPGQVLTGRMADFAACAIGGGLSGLVFRRLIEQHNATSLGG